MAATTRHWSRRSSLAPPLLTPEGAKVQPDWLYAFLQGPITIRPWLDVRMPTFGLDDGRWNAIINYFEATGNSIGSFRTYDHQQLTQHGRAGARAVRPAAVPEVSRAGRDSGRIRPLSNLAPDLRMAHERLKPEWMLDWLRNPSRIQPGTRMPQFWPTPPYPKSSFPQLGGDAEAQIRAIRDYLITFRGGPVAAPPCGDEHELADLKVGTTMVVVPAFRPALGTNPQSQVPNP